MIQVVKTGNVQTVMLDGIRQFDIEHSYAVDGVTRNRGEVLLSAMVEAFNVQSQLKPMQLKHLDLIVAKNKAGAIAPANENKILEFTNNDE